MQCGVAVHAPLCKAPAPSSTSNGREGEDDMHVVASLANLDVRIAVTLLIL